MSENITGEPAGGSDSENQDPTARVLVHVFVLGALAVVAEAFSNIPTSPGTMLPLGGLVGKVLWLMFAVYTVISSIGVICWNNWCALFGMHVAAGVLSYPAAIFLLFLLWG
ncbi:hypothetical protein JRI60_09000 [Archangium violaceum]|uniref:hypothetical protein n=1 Tax=Archangium violaceum TaxID=83451 RepID=UPI001952438B|nr:hypothetical protein [Archangium violaceum]QRN99135.1 hypothetical protein JRI60_09000 [Archangium violaceum]